MDMINLVKKVFPKPRVPQKRYMILIVMVVYAVLRAYVDHTESDWDNKALEAGKGIILDYFADADNTQDDPNHPAYGETS